MVRAGWPGSRLYYTATVQQVMADMGQYEVMYENGVVFTVTPKDVYKQGPHKKHNKSADSSNSDDNKDTTAELTEDDEDITTMLVNAAVKMTNKISNNSFKEPTRVSKVSNGSKASRSSRVGLKSPDLFSDDEEHVSVSQRPSVSSRLSTSSRTSRLNKVSFSSTINRLLDSVFTQNGDKKISVNGKSTDLNGVNGDDISGEKIVNGENGGIETDSKVSTSSRASKVSKSKVKKSSSSSKAANTSQRLDEFSEDENGDMSMTAPAVNPAETAAPTLSGYNIEWIISLFFMVLCPTILITLHNICTSNGKIQI